MNSENIKTTEKNLIIIGQPNSGKSSFISLIKGKTILSPKMHSFGVKYDHFSTKEGHDSSFISIYEVNFDDMDFLESIFENNQKFLQNAIVLLNLEFSQSKISFTKTFKQIEKVRKFFEPKIKKMNSVDSENLKLRIQKFNGIDHTIPALPFVLVLNKFDVYMQSDM